MPLLPAGLLSTMCSTNMPLMPLLVVVVAWLLSLLLLTTRMPRLLLLLLLWLADVVASRFSTTTRVVDVDSWPTLFTHEGAYLADDACVLLLLLRNKRLPLVVRCSAAAAAE